MQIVFSSAGKNLTESWKSWAAMSAREFYDGDLEGDPSDALDVTFNKALGYPISITHLTCRAPLAYRRSWQHIRNNQVGVRVVWFVRSGWLKIVRSEGVCTVREGEVGILDSNTPFHAKLFCDENALHESFQVIVPPHLFMTHLAQAENFTNSFSLNSPDGQVVKKLFDVLIGAGAHMSREAAEPLAESFLKALADCIDCHSDNIPRRQRLVDKRLADIKDYILMNLTDPDLCYDKVAVSCGISPRYLCYLLKADNTSFSELLWQNRLQKARDWLVSPGAQDRLIYEIAFMSGFKSAAHFSRVFKTVYGCSPREYRAAQRTAEADDGPGSVESDGVDDRLNLSRTLEESHHLPSFA